MFLRALLKLRNFSLVPNVTVCLIHQKKIRVVFYKSSVYSTFKSFFYHKSATKISEKYLANCP